MGYLTEGKTCVRMFRLGIDLYTRFRWRVRGTGYRRLSGDSRKVSFIRSIPGGLIDIEGDGGVYIVLMMFGVCGEIVLGVLG